MYYVYFAKSLRDNTYYVGSTYSVDLRIKQHNQGKTKSLKSKLPVVLVFTETYNTKSEARKREIQLKRSWQTKLEIIKKIEKSFMAPSSIG